MCETLNIISGCEHKNPPNSFCSNVSSIISWSLECQSKSCKIVFIIMNIYQDWELIICFDCYTFDFKAHFLYFSTKMDSRWRCLFHVSSAWLVAVRGQARLTLLQAVTHHSLPSCLISCLKEILRRFSLSGFCRQDWIFKGVDETSSFTGLKVGTFDQVDIP